MPVVAALLGVLASIGFATADDQQTEAKSDIQKAVEEFKIETRNMGLRPDSPRRAKKSGGAGSTFHGRLYHNLRNDLFDAVPHEVSQNGGEKNLLRRNQFGFNLSGPVIIPKLYQGQKTFFSISYEGVRERIGRSALRTIAANAERTGDFSQTVDLSGNPLPIHDPSTTRPNPNHDPSQEVSEQNLQYLRDPFPGNVIPVSRLDPVAVKALNYYPTPNTSIGPFFRNNYFVVSPQVNTANGMIARVDHTVRERHRLNFGLSFSNGLAGAARYFNTEADSSSPDREYQSRDISAEHVFTISPQTINSLGIEVSSSRTQDISAASSFASELGLPTDSEGVFPVLRFGAYLGMGNGGPISRNVRNIFNITDAFSTRIHQHNIRASANLIHTQVNTFVPQYPAGSLNFSEGLTSLPGITNTGLAFASYLLGLADYGELSIVPSPSYFSKSSWSFSLRDQYEIRPGLTFTIAGNFEVHTPRVEKYDRQSTIDLSLINPVNQRPGALAIANKNGFGRAFQPIIPRLEPSASLAWSPGSNSRRVLRLAYSRAYTSIPIYSSQFGTQGFNGYETYYSQNIQLSPAVTLAGGLPAVPVLPDLRPEAANNTAADYIDTSSNIPTTQSASASIESPVPGGLVVTAGAYISGGKNMLVNNPSANLNAIHPDLLSYRDQLNNEAFRRTLRPYPQYLSFDVYSSYPGGRYRRDASYIRLEKRTSSGLSLNAYYEYGKQHDDYSGPYGRQDFFNRDNEWSLTPGVSIHQFSLSYAYELPIGASKPFLAYDDWRHVLVDGWSISGITTINGGDPLYLHPQFNNTGGVIAALNVNVVPRVDPAVTDRGPALWFNPAAFDQPADFTLGNASRTHAYLRLPGSQNHDLSVSKRFVLAPDRTMEFTASGFNFINHANWNDPDNVIGPSSSPNVNAGKIIGSHGGRVIQVGLRLSF